MKLSATEVKGDPEGVRYTNIEVIEEGGFDCPDGFYDVTVIGLAPMKVQRLNGYWSPVTVGQRRNL